MSSYLTAVPAEFGVSSLGDGAYVRYVAPPTRRRLVAVSDTERVLYRPPAVGSIGIVLAGVATRSTHSYIAFAPADVSLPFDTAKDAVVSCVLHANDVVEVVADAAAAVPGATRERLDRLAMLLRAQREHTSGLGARGTPVLLRSTGARGFVVTGEPALGRTHIAFAATRTLTTVVDADAESLDDDVLTVEERACLAALDADESRGMPPRALPTGTFVRVVNVPLADRATYLGTWEPHAALCFTTIGVTTFAPRHDELKNDRRELAPYLCTLVYFPALGRSYPIETGDLEIVDDNDAAATLGHPAARDRLRTMAQHLARTRTTVPTIEDAQRLRVGGGGGGALGAEAEDDDEAQLATARELLTVATAMIEDVRAKRRRLME